MRFDASIASDDFAVPDRGKGIVGAALGAPRQVKAGRLRAMVEQGVRPDPEADVEIDQIVERLAWTPRERLQ